MPSFSRTSVLCITVAFAIWVLAFLEIGEPVVLILDYGHFFFIGLLGAIIANSTGSGGGIIFIPFFTSLGLLNTQALGTSIVIQCFGMTAGSLSWLYSLLGPKNSLDNQKKLLKQFLTMGGGATITGVLMAQFLIPEPEISMTFLFRGFSIVFGLSLLISVLQRKKNSHTRHSLTTQDRVAIPLVCLTGGMLVAWISIGVGEWVALYLIYRRFPIMLAICIGVCMSSIAVLAASIYHITILSSVVWEIVIFAAPAAVVGGALAKYLAFRLGPSRLKVFFGTWILVTGLIM